MFEYLIVYITNYGGTFHDHVSTSNRFIKLDAPITRADIEAFEQDKNNRFGKDTTVTVVNFILMPQPAQSLTSPIQVAQQPQIRTH